MTMKELEKTLNGYSITFYIGLTTKDGAKIEETAAIAMIGRILQRYGVYGATIKKNKGIWKGELEESLEVMFINTFGKTLGDIKEIARALKDALDQESILVVYDEPEFEFI